RERFRVNWFVDPTDPIPARWNDRLPVPSWLREMVACDGTVAPVFTDTARPVSVGRSQRAVPDRTRRVVVHRDAGRWSLSSVLCKKLVVVGQMRPAKRSG